MPSTSSVPARLAARLLQYTLATLPFQFSAPPAAAATLPSGFTETAVASGLASPTAMTFAPDGRLFICEQGGRVRIVKNGALLPTPFLTLPVHAAGERGLLGVAFDPDFLNNQYVYVYYTAISPVYHNRLSRFTASGDMAAEGSEEVLLDLDPLSGALNHNGGALHFGPDGKLYAAVGDNAYGANAQSLANLHGKILRLNRDGTIPDDNPFYGVASGNNRAIWALGLRNPFTFTFDPITGAMFINDVGEGGWEEVNEGAAGANYGWPETEGYTSDARFTSPLYAYSHAGGACAIAGGAFAGANGFPPEYAGNYFFADYCAGWIRRIDVAAGAASASGFATGLPSPVDLAVSSDGSLYYLVRGGGSTTGAVYRIRGAVPDGAPQITSHPSSLTVAVGQPATFSVGASGAPPLGYQWQRDGIDIAGATAAAYTIAEVSASDDGARVRAVVTNTAGSASSNEPVLTVTSNQRPTAAIIQPTAGTLYSGGQEIWCEGTGTDPEDGTLPANAFTWQVDFHHDTHSHPFIPPTTGVTAGFITIPTTGETSANVWYRLTLTVVDSEGLTHTTQRDIVPRKSRITLDTYPSGLQLKLDGQPVTTPLTQDSVVGMVRSIEAVSPQAAGGVTWTFGSWSDGGAMAHQISTPAADTAYTAAFSSPSTTGGLVAHWNMDLVSADGAILFDASAGGNHGTITGAVRTGGVQNDSLFFDGVDDRVDIDGGAALDTPDAFTVAFWYLADTNQGSIIAKPYGSSWLNSWQFEFSGQTLSFTSTNGNVQHFDTVTAPGGGAWVHVAGSWDGLTKRLFVNGAAALAVSRSIAMDSSDVLIGGDYNTGQFVLPFNGRVDDVRIYDHAQSAEQIRQLYEGTSEPAPPAAPPPPTEAILEAHFETGAEGFDYVDDTFRGTSSPVYAAGEHALSEGYSGGALKVTLGGIDDEVVHGMSGGWRHSFALSAPATATLSFRYKVTQAGNYEEDEFSEVLVTVDGLQPGVGGTDYVVRIAGDGNGGDAVSTGWQRFEVDLGTLASGTHTVTIGGFNNRKTFNDETTEILIDDVLVSSTASGGADPGADTSGIEAHFDTGEDQFVYADDVWRATAQPGYASGSHAPSAGHSGGALRITLGGIDDAVVAGMSGGWRRNFSLSAARAATLSFRYRLTQASNYEDDEFSDVLVSVAGLQPGAGGTDYVARLVGDGNGGETLTTGWQLFEVDLGTLEPGTHTLTIGGYNNRKTFSDEVTELLIDDVAVVVR